MTPTTAECPECGADVKLPAVMRPGRAINCPECETRFVPGDAAADAGGGAKKPKKKKKKAAADDGGWSYRTSWVRFAVLGVLLVVLGVLLYMWYQKIQRDREAERGDPAPADPTRGPVADDRKPGGKTGEIVEVGKGGNLNPRPDPAAEAARAALAGEWEYRAGDEVYTVVYDATGTFRYTAARPGDAPATLTGRWTLSNPRRVPNPKGAAADRPTTQVTVEWGVVSKPGLKGDLVLLADGGGVVHPLLDRFEPAPGKLPTFRKK
ncbi:MAG: hypothetical protein C0501_06725 [Isosphaera sp.]|nr:hypothetical protein [Isosphaera sp.]